MREWGKLSFRNKLRSALLAVSVLSILITGIFSYMITANIMENNALKLTQDSVVKSAQILDEKLRNLMTTIMTFEISNAFKDMLRDVAAGDKSQYYRNLTSMDNLFSQVRMAEPIIQSIYISTPIGEYYPLTMKRNRDVAFEDTPIYGRIVKENRNLWIDGHEDMLFTGKNRVVALVLLPISPTNEFTVSNVYVVINIREEGLRQVLGTKTVGGSQRFLLNADGQFVFRESDPLVRQAADSDHVPAFLRGRLSGYTSYEYKGDSYLLNYAPLSINDWTVLSIQSKNAVLRDLIYVKWMILAITGCSLIVTALVSGWFTRSLLRPLAQLLQVMKRVEANDMAARFESRSDDELAQVGLRFNRMLEQIIHLIDEVKRAEAGKRTLEIKALSAQMDPHFLYNTLNTIYWKLKLQKVEQSQQMVVSLSRLFQIGLNKGQEMMTLDKEIQHVRQYLELQTCCYENLFEYEIVVREPALLQLSVPRIILQPLVENCILHGFGSMETGGRIGIEIGEIPGAGRWSILVRDNGRGMDESTIRSLYRQDPERGYAVSNLLSRLQLSYGETAELRIDSRPGEGTAVLLNLPLKGDPQHDQP